jgi:putative N6-adenine-specific DNA methylase
MKLVARTLYGLEDVLLKELISLGAANAVIANRAVIFEGDMRLLYKANYCSRTALGFLLPLTEFNIRTRDDLYRGCKKVRWDEYMDCDSTFSVVPVVNSPLFSHTGYPALVVKDSIADYFRGKSGRRPSVDSVNPDLVVNLHISNQRVTISMDSTVIPLFKRGYRADQAIAPINEVLAAGIIQLTGWNGQTSFYDPMCGSGTIPVEAALSAFNIPSGKFRSSFGFQKWKLYEEELFNNVKSDADNKIHKHDLNIYASDISSEAISFARSNISRAGLSDSIDIKVSDFSDIKPFDTEGVIVMNPPYGQRIEPEDIDSLYSMIGSSLKHNFSGYSAWVITSNRESLKKVGLKPAVKHILYNGALECLLVKYELYEGSRKVRDK